MWIDTEFGACRLQLFHQQASISTCSGDFSKDESIVYG
jgi:hypothetical protein